MFLAISTSSGLASSTLFKDNGDVLKTLQNNAQNQQSKDIAVFVSNILNDVNKSHLTNIFVDVGPGSFTGIRTGIALAIGLGSFGIKISGVCALEAINYSLKNNETNLIAIKTIHNEYYFQIFKEEYQQVTEIGVISSDLINDFAKQNNAKIVYNSDINSEMIGQYGFHLAKYGIYNDILPIYVKAPNITKKN